MIILFGVTWMSGDIIKINYITFILYLSDTANALHDSDQTTDEDTFLKQNQTLEEFFFNIYNFLNGDM